MASIRFIVLNGHEEEFFHGASPSFFMLFNAIVKSDKFPAITHVDRTSRIQSINQDCIIYNILTEYRDRGHDPVLLNTSFNGPRHQ